MTESRTIYRAGEDANNDTPGVILPEDPAALYARTGELEAALVVATQRAEAAERRAMVAERRLTAGPAAVALKHVDDYGRAQWVNGREGKFRISYAEWFQRMVELGEVQP